MLFVLGFCVALLLVLMFGRGLWALIGHWSGWRAERKIPSAIRDLEAERDSLRAEKAMMARRLESSTSDIKMRMAEQMAEVARNRNRVLDLTANLDIAQSEIVKLRDESVQKVEQIGALKAQIEENVRAINDAWHRASEHQGHATVVKTAADSLRSEITDRDQRINNLENEARALREIVTMFVPSAEDVRKAKNGKANGHHNAFQEAPMPQPTNGTTIVPPFKPVEAGNPLDMEFSEAVNDHPPSTTRTGQDALTRSASNVLSLAERFRGLQGSVKRR